MPRLHRINARSCAPGPMGHTASPPRRPAQRSEPRGAPPRDSAHPNALSAAEQQPQTCPGKDTQSAAATDLATEQADGTTLISLREGRAHHDAVVPCGRRTCARHGDVSALELWCHLYPYFGTCISTLSACGMARSHSLDWCRQRQPKFWGVHLGVEGNRRRDHLRSTGGSAPTVERATCATT